METKFLSLRHPVELGSRFGDWEICWLGGWNKHRHFYLVMLLKVACEGRHKQKSRRENTGRAKRDLRRVKLRRSRFAHRRRSWWR